MGFKIPVSIKLRFEDNIFSKTLLLTIYIFSTITNQTAAAAFHIQNALLGNH